LARRCLIYPSSVNDAYLIHFHAWLGCSQSVVLSEPCLVLLNAGAVIIGVVGSVVSGIVVALTVHLLIHAWSTHWLEQRNAFARNFIFPESVSLRLTKQFSQLGPEAVADILDRLKVYLLICRDYRDKRVAMPSRYGDCAWHWFILCTNAYQIFCDKAVGRFIYHWPNSQEALPGDFDVARAFDGACEYLDNAKDVERGKLPRLFELDQAYGHPAAIDWTLSELQNESLRYKVYRKEQREIRRKKEVGGADGSGAACGCGGSC
jgi:hypothetical protein